MDPCGRVHTDVGKHLSFSGLEPVGRIGAEGVIRHSRPQARCKSSRAGAAPRSALAELADRFGVAAPIDRKQSRAHVAVKRRMRPIADPRDQPMLERVDVAIFDMARVISLIADQMLPEPPLPDATFRRAPCEPS